MLDELIIQPLTDAFGRLQQALFESAVQPLLSHAGQGNLLEDGYAATGWLLVGLIQLVLMLLLFAPLQRWWPRLSMRPCRPTVPRVGPLC